MNKKNFYLGFLSILCIPLIAVELPHIAPITQSDITQARQALEEELTIKEYLSKSGYVIATAALGTTLYKAGFFNWILGNQTKIAESAAFITQEAWQKVLERIAVLEAANKGGYFIIDLLKSVWFQGITLVAGGILVQAPIMSILAKPDYDWIFKHKTHVLLLTNDAVEIAKRYAEFLVSKPLRAQYYKEELLQVIANLAHDFPVLIAYLEHRADKIDADEEETTDLSVMPRFLFNAFNEFLDELQKAFEENNGATVVNLTKGLHSDLFTHANQCVLVDKR